MSSELVGLSVSSEVVSYVVGLCTNIRNPDFIALIYRSMTSEVVDHPTGLEIWDGLLRIVSKRSAWKSPGSMSSHFVERVSKRLCAHFT